MTSARLCRRADNSGTPNIPHVVLTSGYDLGGDRTSLSSTVAGTADFQNNYVFDNDQRLITLRQEQQSRGNTVANKEVGPGKGISPNGIKLSRNRSCVGNYAC